MSGLPKLTKEELALDEERRVLAEGPMVEAPPPIELKSRHALCEVCQGEGILFERISFWCPACLGKGGNDPGMVRAARDWHRGFYHVVDLSKVDEIEGEAGEGAGS